MNYNKYKIGASILRFLIGFFIFKDFIVYAINSKYLFNQKGIISYETYIDIINYFGFKYFFFDFTNNTVIYLYLFLGIIFSLLLTLGVLQRFSVIVLFVLLFVFKIRNIYLLDGADNVISVMLPFFLFVNTFSFSEKYEKLKQKILQRKNLLKIDGVLSKYFSYAIMIQICFIYFFAGLHKLQGEVWQNGTALYYILNSNDFSPTILNQFITSSLLVVKLLTWFTIFFQLTFPILVWIPKLRKPYIILGIILHLGIFFMMKIDNFSFVMISCYAIFFNNDFYTKNFKYFKRLHL
ncbi:HTTM domain-containing protein [Polaribacter cellanae]|uniref:HTTM domain-containing protein n=1 Tax=Polaribacter cellanae TaxID=2818493 RepID=A0A975CRE5_9FLAO|nr:HTTM domain-containing protein [Polaribacter cellanae]QTE21836.1 HTTM domain-containing protein [Polaribacter cellanae]